MSLELLMLCLSCGALALYCWVIERRVEKLEKLYLRTVPVSEWYEGELLLSEKPEDA